MELNNFYSFVSDIKNMISTRKDRYSPMSWQFIFSSTKNYSKIRVKSFFKIIVVEENK